MNEWIIVSPILVAEVTALVWFMNRYAARIVDDCVERWLAR